MSKAHKAKRSARKQAPVRPQSPAMLLALWVGGLLSAGLLYGSARALVADLASFRSCSINDAGLTATGCGKGSLNAGDLMLFVLCILSAGLCASLFTHAWRTTRGSSS